MDKLGKPKEARKQLELSLEASLRTSDETTELKVTLARHILAENLNHAKSYEEVIELVKPFIGTGCNMEWLLSQSLARAYYGLNDFAKAEEVVNQAVENVPVESRETVRKKILNGLQKSVS